MLPPPNQFQTEKPPCIRAAMMEHAVADLRFGFNEKIDEIIAEFIAHNPKLDQPTALVIAFNQIQQKLSPYSEAAENIMKPVRTTLYNAQQLEAKGNPDGAALLYEIVVQAGFTASAPYERLRIIYTKQKQYQKAIEACEHYIFTLNLIRTFWPHYPNIASIPEYENHIAKLKAKMGKIIDAK